MPRNTRSTRKGKDLTKDYNKLNEGSPLPQEEEVVPATVTKKKMKKQLKAA